MCGVREPLYGRVRSDLGMKSMTRGGENFAGFGQPISDSHFGAGRSLR
jgi:hypothetical protein